MKKRDSISTRTRFEVFKRDKFSCTYCGRSAPDVILEIDHIKPVSEGGTNDLMNLTTACKKCNMGKSNKKLSDTSAIISSRRAAQDAQERANQITLMAEWQASLIDAEKVAYQNAAIIIFEKATGRSLTEYGIVKAAEIYKKLGASEFSECLQIVVSQYGQIDNILDTAVKIAANRKKTMDDPSYGEAVHVMNYANRVYGLTPRQKGEVLRMAKNLIIIGTPKQQLIDFIKSNKNKTDFLNALANEAGEKYE